MIGTKRFAVWGGRDGVLVRPPGHRFVHKDRQRRLHVYPAAL